MRKSFLRSCILLSVFCAFLLVQTSEVYANQRSLVGQPRLHEFEKDGKMQEAVTHTFDDKTYIVSYREKGSTSAYTSDYYRSDQTKLSSSPLRVIRPEDAVAQFGRYAPDVVRTEHAPDVVRTEQERADNPSFWDCVKNPIACAVGTGANWVIGFASMGLYLAGNIFDTIIDTTVTNSDLINNLKPSIDVSWKIVRDIANIVIVFSLLYLGIKTILNGNGFAETKVLISVIIAAILINFSLVVTRTVFDISNLIGSQIAQQITIEGQSSTKKGISGISEGLVSMVRPDKLTNFLGNHRQNGWPDLWNKVQTAIFTVSAILMLIVVLLGAAILLMYRFLIFVVLMITSPIGITSKFIPWFEKMGESWWKALKSQAIVLPAFLLTLYISVLFVSFLSQGLSETTISAGTFTGGTVDQIANGLVKFVFHYLLIIGFLLLPLIVPGKLGAAGADMMTGAADWTTKKIKAMPRRTLQRTAQVGASGVARSGRYLIGNKFANKIGGNTEEKRKALQEKARSGNFLERTTARAKLNASESLKGKTFDIRNSETIKKSEFGKGMGKGIENYTEAIKTKEKAFNTRKDKEMKLFGYDKLHETAENQVAITRAETRRDDLVKNLDERKRFYENGKNNPAMSDAELTRLQAQVQSAAKYVKDAEAEVGRLKNIGTDQYVETDSQLLTRRVENFMSSTSKDTLKKVREENKKKWEKDGQSSGKKRQKAEDNWVDTASSGTGTPTPPPPPATPPTPPPTV